MALIAQITYRKAFSKWVPDDQRVEAVECNNYIRRAFGKLPDQCGQVVLKIWNEKPETENPVHEMVSTFNQHGPTNAFLSKFKRNQLTHHHMSWYWMKILNSEGKIAYGDCFYFELEPLLSVESKPLSKGGFPV